MASPASSVEYDFHTPDTCVTPTKSEQSTGRAPPSSIEHDPENPPPEIPATSGHSTRRIALSSIEHDPDNPPPETPVTQDEPIQIKILTRRERIRIQLPLWRQHIYDFRYYIYAALGISLLAIIFCIIGYIVDMKIIFLGIATGLLAVGFSFTWLTIAPGPPFESDIHGNEIIPAYRLAGVYEDSTENMKKKAKKSNTPSGSAEQSSSTTSESTTEQSSSSAGSAEQKK